MTAWPRLAVAQKLTASQLFVNAPAQVFPTIDSLTRLDMLDYFNSGAPKPSKNAFKGDCIITAVTPDQLTVQTSSISESTITLLPAANDTIVMLINTYALPAQDSAVSFYTTAWKPITKGLFVVPTLSDWLSPETLADKEEVKNAENICPFTLARCSYDPSTRQLTLINNLGGVLPREHTQWAGKALRATLKYRWNGKKMEKLKE